MSACKAIDQVSGKEHQEKCTPYNLIYSVLTSGWNTGALSLQDMMSFQKWLRHNAISHNSILNQEIDTEQSSQLTYTPTLHYSISFCYTTLSKYFFKPMLIVVELLHGDVVHPTNIYKDVALYDDCTSLDELQV